MILNFQSPCESCFEQALQINFYLHRPEAYALELETNDGETAQPEVMIEERSSREWAFSFLL